VARHQKGASASRKSINVASETLGGQLVFRHLSTMDTAAGSDRALAQQLTIVNRKGLHARASARFVRTAECFEAEIKVVRDGQAVNGNSIMGLMMLGAGPGSTILVQATGKQAREALDAITTLVNNGFDEDSDGAPAA
jgi:phosphocarrier protein HPr